MPDETADKVESADSDICFVGTYGWAVGSESGSTTASVLLSFLTGSYSYSLRRISN